METNDEKRHADERRPVEEAGGGVSEGFEQAEEELIENASHGDGTGDPATDAIGVEAEESTAEYGEADEETNEDR